MARFGVVGDQHGYTKSFTPIINHMGERKISHVFVVGDFGLWTHVADGHQFLDDINCAAEANNLTIFAVGGNHENWDHWNWFVENMPTHKGFAMVRRRVLLAPKAHHFKMFDKQFVVAGGAVSIDKQWRVDRERGYDQYSGVQSSGTGPRTLWWPNEELTDDDVRNITNNFPKADILLTHDCSNYTQFKNRLKPDADSERHRRRIDEVIRAVQPGVHFHGHMHEKYEWNNTLGTDAFGGEPVVNVRTYGMECNGDYNAWGIYDTDTGEFAYRGAGMQFRSLKSI